MGFLGVPSGLVIPWGFFGLLGVPWVLWVLLGSLGSMGFLRVPSLVMPAAGD